MVKYNKDDGLEFFGGTVAVKHVVLQGIADDSVDWTDGWTGKGQFIIVMQSGDDADQGIEADNNGDNNNLTPRSNPTLYNLTLIGDPDTDQGSESDVGILLREGTSATLRNFIVTGFKEASVDIDHPVTFEQIENGSLTVGSGILYGNCVVSRCVDQFRPDRDDAAASITTQAFVAGSANISFDDPMLADPFNLTDPDYRPAATSPALTGAVAPAVPPNDGFFDVANFIGAGRTGRRRTGHLVARVDRLRSQLTAFPPTRRNDTPPPPDGGCRVRPPPRPGARRMRRAAAPRRHPVVPGSAGDRRPDALADGAADRLAALALNGREFRDVVWPALPASRPERGVPVSYAWGDLNQKSANALRRLVARWGGHRFTLLDVAYDGGTTDYGAFRVHRETRLRVRDENGREIEMRFYGSTLVRGGEHKVFSFVVD